MPYVEGYVALCEWEDYVFMNYYCYLCRQDERFNIK